MWKKKGGGLYINKGGVMQKYVQTICIFVVILIIFAVSAADLEGQLFDPLRFRMVPVSLPQRSGTADLRLIIASSQNWGKVKVKLELADRLEYAGPKEWKLSLADGDSVEYNFQVIIPPNDTSGIRFNIYVGSHVWQTARRYFVTTGDTLEVYQGKPKPPPLPEPSRGVPDSLLLSYWGSEDAAKDWHPFRLHLLPYKVPQLAGEALLKLKIYSRRDWGPCIMRLKRIEGVEYSGPTEWPVTVNYGDTLVYDVPVIIPPNDTSMIRFELATTHGFVLQATQYFVTTGDKLETTRAKPRKREIPPHLLEKYTTPAGPPDTIPDTVMIDKTMPLPDDVVEQLGGKKQPKVEILPAPDNFPKPQTDDSILDSLRESKGDAKIETVLDLRNPEHLGFAKSIIDNLTEMDISGYYRAIISTDQAAALSRKGIPIARYPQIPGETNPSEKDLQNALPLRNRPPEPLEKPGGWDPIYTDGFENGLGQYWYAIDFNDTSGLDYWDTISVYESWGRASAGLKSAWCSRIGSRPVLSNYDTYMDSWLIIGFILPDYDYLLMEFDIWYSTQEDYDVCVPYYSIDGQYWDPVELYEIYTGSSFGWYYDESYAIDKGTHDTVWIAFRFYSNNAYNYEGVFLDNFRLWGWSDARPDLTPYTPSGWTGPIVPSVYSGTSWLGELYAGYPTYVDLAIVNSGNAPADPFRLMLLVDGEPRRLYETTAPLPAYSYAVVEDDTLTLASGTHELQMDVDCEGAIDESNEDNNSYNDLFFWEIYQVWIDGTLEYRDMGNGGHLCAARNVEVELWDKNNGDDIKISGPDTVYTDDLGIFDFGLVDNLDTEGLGLLDPYFRFIATNPGGKVCIGPGDPCPMYHCSSSPNFDITDDITIWIYADSDQSGRFYIIDKILDGYRKWQQLRPNDYTMPVDIILCDSVTGYLRGTNCIYIDTSDNDLEFRPDTYDQDIILEEYGHKISRDFFIFDNGFQSSHWWFTKISLEFGAAEAFGYFWSCLARNSHTLVNR